MTWRVLLWLLAGVCAALLWYLTRPQCMVYYTNHPAALTAVFDCLAVP